MNGTGGEDASGTDSLSNSDIVDSMTRSLRALGTDCDTVSLMHLATSTAAAGLAGAAAAGIALPTGDRFTTTAATHEVAIEVDALQRLHGGPCVTALTGGPPVIHVDDLREDVRWPAFATAAVAGTQVLGLVSYRLWVGSGDPIGAFNLYAVKPHAFDASVLAAGARLAVYTAALLAHAREHEKVANLERALESNRSIGVAIGILMTQRLVTRERAFDLLSSASQQRNRKVRDLAGDIIQTGDLLS